MTKSRNINAPRHRWTPTELAYLREHYPHQRTADLAQHMGISLHVVYATANRVGLHKSQAFAATDKSGRILKGGKLGQASQFRPGEKPWNAGTHYTPGGRCVQTQFKPGNKPTNTQPVGAYRIATGKNGHKHLERKTGTAKGGNHKRWTPVARLVWEAVHGPVPAGSIVVFKPGQHTLVLQQITVDRIECITRRENARRNHPASYSLELARLIQLKGAITRQVNRIQKEYHP